MNRPSILRAVLTLFVLATLSCESVESETEKTCRYWFEAEQNLETGVYVDGVEDPRFMADLRKIDDTLLQSEPLVLAAAENMLRDIAKIEIEARTLKRNDVSRMGDRLTQACIRAGALP